MILFTALNDSIFSLPLSLPLSLCVSLSLSLSFDDSPDLGRFHVRISGWSESITRWCGASFRFRIYANVCLLCCAHKSTPHTQNILIRNSGYYCFVRVLAQSFVAPSVSLILLLFFSPCSLYAFLAHTLIVCLQFAAVNSLSLSFSLFTSLPLFLLQSVLVL